MLRTYLVYNTVTPEKSSSHLSGGSAIVITTGKKKSSRLSGGCTIGSDSCEIIRFLRKIECIEFECNEFVLVLVRIDLIHFEHSIRISSTSIKTNTHPLVQLQHIHYI